MWKLNRFLCFCQLFWANPSNPKDNPANRKIRQTIINENPSNKVIWGSGRSLPACLPEMLKPASAASIAGVKKLKVGVKFWATGIYFGGFPFLTVGFSFSQGVLNFYYV